MLPVKLPYYPKIEATMRETRFGAMEISVPEIYDKPVSGKVIVKIDCLNCLRELLGNDCFICRELLYTILAGEHPLYNVNDVFASYYRKYANVTAYVNDMYYYGDDSIPILERCILPLRDKVNTYKDDLFQLLNDSGGKYLISTHDYLYFAFLPNAKLPEIKGAEIIC